ncbi:DUF6124 family protein [Pseudomonas sp. PDM04]|uniref:DUF6124 family protein n=1 Tax=Pseudomonas sp. PDM04 TaxID=2769296 RepID=UPI00177BD985|nr:hypothetical protein [Pseudomonas sp. PDM04]MBD9441414.1 hypothetical protein [Pseudomonas sp. PDM04]
MRKVKPDPPETDTDEAPLSAADIQATPRTPCTMYFINPDVHVQDLLGSVSESLASAAVITMDLADRETGPGRNTLLGIAQIVMLAEVSVNSALDQLDPGE